MAVSGTARIVVVAGSDLDNDGFVCRGGEVCGIYPELSSSVTPLAPTGNPTGIDFVLTPNVAGNAGGSASMSFVSQPGTSSGLQTSP